MRMMSLLTWRAPPKELALEDEQVHVWRASLDGPPSRVDALRQTMTVDELERSERYRFDEDRWRFVVARGTLRCILARYLKTVPEQVRLRYGKRGKPHLVGQSGAAGLQFNVAHADGLALFAVARGRRIGVDIEGMDRDLAALEIADRFFSPREIAALRQLPAEARAEGFFNGWTRKEAYIKARGDGLSLPLDRFEVSLAPGEPAALLSTAWDPEEASRWSLKELVPGPGYAGAVAVEGRGWQLKCWEWDGG